jgi:hypothetical protein
MAVLVGLQTAPLNYSQAFIADYTVGITVALLQPVPTLAVLTIHSFCRLSWPSTISVGARLFTVDSRLSSSLLSPTTFWLSEIPVLKWACTDGIVNTLPHRSYTQCMDLVTGETSVVYFTWVANRCYGHEIRNQPSVEWQRHRFPGIRLHGQQRRSTYREPVTIFKAL